MQVDFEHAACIVEYINSIIRCSIFAEDEA